MTYVNDTPSEAVRICAERAPALHPLLIDAPALPQTAAAVLSVQPSTKSEKFRKNMYHIVNINTCNDCSAKAYIPIILCSTLESKSSELEIHV